MRQVGRPKRESSLGEGVAQRPEGRSGLSLMPHVWPTVVHMLQDAARRAPEHPALRCGNESLSYRQYAACVAGLALELQERGVGAGQRVALMMANSLDIAIATFAVQAAGAQVVPLNPAYTSAELIPILADAAPALLLHDVAVAEVVAGSHEALAGVAVMVVGEGARRFTAWRDRPDLAERLPLPSPDTLSTLQYTGGTTGVSKGVDLGHRAVSINVSQREALLPTRPEDERILAITPLFHVYAVSMGLYLAAYCRGTLVILPRYRPDWVLEAIASERITLLSGSPTIFVGLMAYEGFGQADLSSLRLCFSGSSALSEETLRRWEAATGCVVAEGYGQSEAGPVLTYNPGEGLRKLGTVGYAVPQTELQIVDVTTGRNVLPAGEVGEIRARGPQIMSGYRNRPAETAEALRNGWLHTGDIGSLDADGYLTIRDRKKDMAIVSGFNVYPREVEDALYSHAAVIEAAVVGLPDSYRGERLVACVVCRHEVTVEDLQAHLQARLVKYKWPSELRVVAALPKTTVGKIDKKQLRLDLLAQAGVT